MRRTLFLQNLALAIGIGLFLVYLPLSADSNNPHEVTSESQATSCNDCHRDKPAMAKSTVLETKNEMVKREQFTQDGTAMCSSCHNPDDGHKVGLELDFKIPADLPLADDNKMVCLTCHYTHGSLQSKRPQASYSLMDRIFDAERLHKSFLLRRNNTDGELCLICHNVNQGSN